MTNAMPPTGVINLCDIPTKNSIKREVVTIHCKTQEEYNTLMDKLDFLGWRFRSGQRPKEKDYFYMVRSGEMSHINLWKDEGCISICGLNGIDCQHCNYACGRHEHYDLIINPIKSIQEPKNNDGRITCFWCNISTQKRGNGVYDICPKCGK